MKIVERLIYADYLKFLGLVLVILAHVNAPAMLQQFRSFDVPLMVFISVVLALQNNKIDMNVDGSTWIYIKKRSERLVIPTYIFLAFFLSAMTISGHFPGWCNIIKSFFFQRDCSLAGYVWVIWIFLIVSICISLLKEHICSIKIKTIMISIILYELLCSYTELSEYRIAYYTIFTIFPWGVWTYFCFYYVQAPTQIRNKMFFIALILYVFGAVYLISTTGAYVYTSSFKYPARSYYFLFAFLIIHIVFCLVVKYSIRLPKLEFIIFCSRNSLWIYLWHIFFLAIYKYIFRISSWELEYFLVLVSSIAIMSIQVFIINHTKKLYNSRFKKYLLG